MSKAIRPIRIEGQLAYVTLTKGYEAVIDAVDAPLVSASNWSAALDKGQPYARRGVRTGGPLSMHRLIVGAKMGEMVDHKDGNGLNNRRSNLRIVSAIENAWNVKRKANNTSGFKGVYWNCHHNRWVASISIRGKRIYLGHFKTPESAHVAYCEASAKHHGEFGRTE